MPVTHYNEECGEGFAYFTIAADEGLEVVRIWHANAQMDYVVNLRENTVFVEPCTLAFGGEHGA